MRHFHFRITGKTEGKLESCTPSLGRPVELWRFYRQTRHLITCNARPQTPQRHWLALQCNETGYPVKWAPHVPSGATIRPDLFKERTAEKNWKTGLDFQQTLLLVPARNIWCVYDCRPAWYALSGWKSKEGSPVDQCMGSFCVFLSTLLKWWCTFSLSRKSQSVMCNCLIMTQSAFYWTYIEPFCVCVLVWRSKAHNKTLISDELWAEQSEWVWWQTFNEPAIPQSCCTINFMTNSRH